MWAVVGVSVVVVACDHPRPPWAEPCNNYAYGFINFLLLLLMYVHIYYNCCQKT